jgi:hypothetical protein
MTAYPWYCLHFMTCLILLVLTSALVSRNQPGPDCGLMWPLLHYEDQLPGSHSAHFRVEVLNILASMMIVLCTALFLERWLRKPRVLRLRLRTAFALTAVIASMFAFRRWENSAANYNYKLPSDWLDHPAYLALIDDPWWISASIYFGLACTLYTGGWLTTHFAGSCWTKLSSRTNRSCTA